MSPAKFRRIARIAKLIDQERSAGTAEWWFLHFVDPDALAGQGFLGACIVEGYGLVTAIDKAWKLGINPGGAVIAYHTPPHDPAMRNRLITSDEDMAKLGYVRRA